MFVGKKQDYDEVVYPDTGPASHHSRQLASARLKGSGDDSAWRLFRASGRVRIERCDQHDVLFHEDDPATNLYEITSGQVMLYRLLVTGA